MANNQKSATRGINSVDHALRLVAYLAQNETNIGSSATDITKALSLPRPTVYRLLATLQEHNWVIREDRHYRLTLKLLDMADAAFSAKKIQAICQPYLMRLSEQTGETAHFAILDGTKAAYIAKVESDHTIRMISHIGWRGPLHATAVGKVMLSWCEPQTKALVLSEPLERFTQRTLTQPELLEQALETVRQQGYAIDDHELLDGLVCVAAPVVVRGKLIGAVSISGPDSRRSTLLAGVPRVQETGNLIAQALG